MMGLYDFISKIGLQIEARAKRFKCNIFKCTFLNEDVSISTEFSLQFAPKDPIYNESTLV